jgi:putative methyltransferase (TIGR04325 family)
MGSETAEEKMAALVGRGQPPDLTGADLPVMAREETNRNLWAVRWLYHHLLHDGLCFRPPWSMVRHEGFDVAATNAQQATDWDSGPLRAAPPGPATWPEPRVHPACPALWRFALPPPPPRPSRIRTRLKQVLRKLVPASLRASIRERYHHIRWEGDFGSWAEARERSTGYDAPAIVARVAGALQEVKAGRALFERDGVAFISPAPVWPALDWVFRRAGIRHGSLRLLDFGGSLGSLYFQYRTVWDELPDVRWRVVEQPLFVETGRREFGDGRLSFFETVELAEAAGASDVLLLSGVIQCMEDPHALIESLLAKDFECIILDRTPLITRGRDRLTVQHVPATLGCASYPCWHFDRNKLLAHFLRRYICAVEYLGTDGVLGEATYRGFIFTRRDSGIHADGDAET